MKVFISYTLEDRSTAERLSHYLADRGFQISTGSTSANPGDVLTERISEEIATSDAVILLISKGYEYSRWAEFELSMAVYQKTKGRVKGILPVITAPGASLPPLLNGVLGLDATNRTDDEVYSHILQSLRSIETAAHPATDQLKWLNEQSEALKLEVMLSRPRTDQLTRSIAKVGSLLAILGISLGIGLLATVGKLRLGNWIERTFVVFVPLLSAVIGYYFGRRTGESAAPAAAGTHESAVRE